MATESVRPEPVIAASESFLNLAAEFGETDAAERVKASLEKLRLGIFRLVVVGEIKRGKSSFINALLGEPGLLPTDDNVATSTVYKIAYGDQKSYRVFFAPPDPERLPAPKDVTQEELATYGTETGNPHNDKGVDFIAAQLPNPLLKQGLAIVDTPGLGGLFAQHAAITWRYVPSADAVFFVLDSVEAVVSQPEMDALARLREMTPLLFFVQTKTDLTDEEKWRAWDKRNREIISNTLKTEPDKLIYFPVSNALKHRADRRNSPTDLERSGFAPLLQFLNSKLIGAMRERLARALLNNVAREAADIRRRLTEEQHIFSEESAEALRALEREYNETKERFEEWRPKARGLLNDLRNRLVDTRMHAQHRLQNELDPAPLGPIVDPLIEGLRSSDANSRQLASQAEAIQGKLVDFACRIISQIQDEYNCRVIDLAEETKARIGRSLELALPAAAQSAPFQAPDHLDVHLSGFEAARSGFYGGIFGGTVATMAASWVFPPLGLAVTVAGLVGTAVGILFGHRDHEIRKREEVLSKLSAVLSNTMRLAQQSARQELERTAARHEQTATEAFETAAAKTERELREKMDAIAEAGKRSRGENAQKAMAIQKRITQVDAVLELVAACLPPKEAQQNAMTA